MYAIRSYYGDLAEPPAQIGQIDLVAGIRGIGRGCIRRFIRGFRGTLFRGFRFLGLVPHEFHQIGDGIVDAADFRNNFV